MVVHTLTPETRETFLEYCRKHRYVHDESFLYDEDLAEFVVGETNPTWLLFATEDPDATVVGALSLMADEYYLRGRRLRVRILHCEETSDWAYRPLLQAASPVDRDVDRIEMFLPDTLTRTRAVLEGLGFAYYRTSFVMTRRAKPAVQAKFPEGFRLRPAVGGKDEDTYASIRNAAFAILKGSETPITAAEVAEQMADSDVLEEGMQILVDGETPVGIIRMLRESGEDGDFSFVAPLALIPSYQGRGLGSALLQAGIQIGQRCGLADCMLVVNAENDQALGLYRKNGFQVDEAVTCLVLPVASLQIRTA